MKQEKTEGTYYPREVIVCGDVGAVSETQNRLTHCPLKRRSLDLGAPALEPSCWVCRQPWTSSSFPVKTRKWQMASRPQRLLPFPHTHKATEGL